MTDFPSALVEIRKATREPGLAAGLHVAIIMDRSRACQRHGLEAVQRAIEAAARNGVTHLTLFGAWPENQERPGTDMQDVLRHYLQDRGAVLEEGEIRLSVIGAREQLSPEIVALIAAAEERTQTNPGINPGLHLTIALSYGGRADIVSASRRLATLVRDGTLAPHDIDEDRLGASLSTGALPPPDLMIRTGGEQRLGNFLLWQLAYAEMIFVDKHWPDFTGEDLEAAILEFRRRDRRFGAIPPKVSAAILAGAAILP